MLSSINTDNLSIEMMATKKKKTTTSIHTIRQTLKQDNSPSWDGHEDWPRDEFRMKFHESMQYYNLLLDKKEHKQLAVKWMIVNGFDSNIIKDFKKIKDWRCSPTIGNIISCLNKGMPVDCSAVGNKNVVDWLTKRIYEILEASKDDLVDDQDDNETQRSVIKVDKNEEIINNTIADLDGIFDTLYKNIDRIDPKSINYEAIFKEHGVKSVHVDTIKSVYASIMQDTMSLIDKTCDDQLKESYSAYSMKQLRKVYEIYSQLYTACDKLVEESVVIRKPRVKKPVSKEKLVEKLKFKQEDDKLNIKSIDPTTIIGANELFYYDTKTRKLYKMVASDKNGLTVKGSIIENYDEKLSIGKTLKNPVEQLTKFKNSGKLAVSKFLDDLDTLDIKASGKLTEHQVLLKIL
jgi:hypothetical protein